MIYIRSIIRKAPPAQPAEYPCTLPLIGGLAELALDAPVTIFAGENGSGKTTLIELLAAKLEAVRIGGFDSDRAWRIARAAEEFTLIRSRKPARCFYFSAEEFNRELERRTAMRADAAGSLSALEEQYAGRSAYAKALASMPYARTLFEMDAQYAHTLSERSHGEGYLDFFSARIRPNGLYLLDEPEAALSYFNQLVLLNMMRDAVDAGCQFILSTHSPVLCAYPDARLLELRHGALAETAYDALENVRFLRTFLAQPERLLRE